ncbi:MAG: DUF6379 domain-containing protein [Nocardioides sp.]|uniref:C-glycoside deglycosidase beta subunit domain-containing protein n=1 Tax=Nocardioides sp. TaxID=35761 RepID=UPI0039E68121
MFDRYIVVEGSLRNRSDETGETTGFAVDARIPYYRGLGLSMVEVDLTVDDEIIPRDQVSFVVHGNSYRSDEMDEVYDDRWGFTEAATLVVDRPGGLPAGEHRVSVLVSLRISYIGGTQTTGTRVLEVA